MPRAVNKFWPAPRAASTTSPPSSSPPVFAKAKKDMVGKRPRTTYSITPKGRRALAEWLAIEGKAPELEFEALMKVFFGEHGDRESMRSHLAAARRFAEERQEEAVELVQGYLRDGGPFPDRLPIMVLTGRFLNDFARLVGGWAEWAEKEIATWPDDVADAEPNRAVMEAVASRQPLPRMGAD